MRRPMVVVLALAACGGAAAAAPAPVVVATGAEQRDLAPEASAVVTGDIVSVHVVRPKECRASPNVPWKPCGTTASVGTAVALGLVGSAPLTTTTDADGNARFDLSKKRSSDDTAHVTVGAVELPVSLKDTPMRFASRNEAATRDEATSFHAVESDLTALEARVRTSRVEAPAAGLAGPERWKDSDDIVDRMDKAIQHMVDLSYDGKRLEAVQHRWAKVKADIDQQRVLEGKRHNCVACMGMCQSKCAECDAFCKGPMY